ncbi:unnamed protein product [Porites lobata]|uniref:SH3 domain-containing protein n=1 Tax=Porites lobata TaxID=104759 RepID=A0ABN8NWL7_9CNID|nr:unnamed protein product [Porites lobata]
MENMDVDQDDDSDSGISQAYSPAAVHSTLRMPDIAKTELASKLAAATSGSPAHIKARVLWKYEGVEPTDLNADKGEIVLLLYRDKSKVYAVNSKGKKGFIPFNYCSVLRKNDFVTNGSFSPAEQTDEDGNFRPVKVYFHDDFIKENDTNLFHSRNTRISEKQDSSSIPRCRSDESLFGRNKQKSRTRQLSSSLEELTDDNQTTSMVSSLIQWDRKAPETYRRRQKVKVTHFRKFENDAVMVLYDFQAADENDLDVYRGEVVTVLNRDDNDWWWVMRVDGAEGFIPSSYASVEAVRFTGKYFDKISTETVKCGAIVEVCQGTGRFTPFAIRVWLNVNPIFGRILWQRICVSEHFCVNLTSWLFHQWRGMKESNADKQARCVFVFNLGKACSLYMQEKKAKSSSQVCSFHIYINVQPLTCLCVEPDLNWCRRLLVGLVEYMQLQDVMAWLSTLGGAYSAMGEHFCSYSEKAGQISQHQFLVAMRLGNPILAAQCKVFAAMSLIQRGRLKMASKVIREQYHLALNGLKDEKLLSSCKAAWIRIQYIRKQRKEKLSRLLSCKDASTR